MKKFTKVIALILSLMLLLCFPIGVSAAEAEDTGADTAVKGSLTIYKVDLTNAKKDDAWDSSYVSTGVYDQNVNDALNSYALKDVEFTYLRVADVVQLTGSAADGADSDHVETLYGISKTAGADLLNALGLGNGANRYEKADGSDQLDDSKYYYQSDVLISALSTALKANATTVKNALEAYVTESGTAMPLTDTYGKTKAENLELGLYLVVETRVPEMVTSTCNPFFICLPMTSSGGSWIYDVTVYPKNLTGNPTLDKTLRESKDDTGKIFIVTGTGKYFKNVDADPETNLGIVRIAADGQTAELLWGYSDGGKFTSEFPAHLMSHMARLSVDPDNRVVMHCHPTNTLAMNYVHELDEKKFTHTLWEMCTECIVVFPDGIGVLPWMLCGTNSIGEATAEKMKEFRLVVWGMHGIYGAGKTMDETFGLIETVEKAAQIYMLTAHLPWVNTIRDDQMKELAEYFGVSYRKDFLNL